MYSAGVALATDSRPYFGLLARGVAVGRSQVAEIAKVLAVWVLGVCPSPDSGLTAPSVEEPGCKGAAAGVVARMERSSPGFESSAMAAADFLKAVVEVAADSVEIALDSTQQPDPEEFLERAE